MPPSRCPIALSDRQLPTFTKGNPRATHRKYGNKVAAKGAMERNARFPKGMVRKQMDASSVMEAPIPTTKLATNFFRAILGSSEGDNS
jgi:hypothetical protein